ncbi:MAG: Stp1/IreP family PP2C-type Ser/Thr phosphatase [Clostridiales bacterium]|jgi:protein phosphatase|nr:Stp1/IreP family PP2C-type Ser/Thr phosphatase [Clostridiales bacterium]
MNVFGITDVGKIRENNEDSLYFSDSPVCALPNLYIVADGMGGHCGGEVASSKAIEFFRASAEACGGEILDILISAARAANAGVYAHSLSAAALSGMGTTLSACAAAEGKLYAAHIGDSRIYLVSRENITQLTQDHTYVAEMVRHGDITPEQARTHPQRNFITKALGTEPEVFADGLARDVSAGDKVLLCSDGLYGQLPDGEILRAVSENYGDNEAAGRLLLELALKNGGDDNITLILFDVN